MTSMEKEQTFMEIKEKTSMEKVQTSMEIREKTSMEPNMEQNSIKLRLQHYLEKSFQDHSFYIVEIKTLKPIIIRHPASIRLGLI